MELSGSLSCPSLSLKKFLILSQKNLFLYFVKRNFLIFQKTEVSNRKNTKMQKMTFRARKVKKNLSEKNFLYFGKGSFLAQNLKKLKKLKKSLKSPRFPKNNQVF